MFIILSIILIIFPFLLYLLLSFINIIYKKNIDNILFIMVIFFSLLMCFITGNLFIENKLVIYFSNIPIIICYLKKKRMLGCCLSIIMIIYNYLYGYNISIIIVLYLLFLIGSIILKKDKYLIYVSCLIILFSIYLFKNDIVQSFIYILAIYFMLVIFFYLFLIIDKMKEVFIVYDNSINEKKIRDSLFKLTHEIKNPLAVCHGYVDMIDYNDIDRSKKYINIIDSEINRSLNIINDYMNYSKLKLNIEEMDVVILINDILDMLNILCIDKNIDIKINNKYDEILILGDYERLKQVLVNIVKNSIDAILNNGIIEIDIKIINNYLNIIISDNGIGMDDLTINKIKEMFYTTKRNGTGIGVPLSNEIILKHFGKLEYTSSLGVGTKCIVKLPFKSWVL